MRTYKLFASQQLRPFYTEIIMSTVFKRVLLKLSGEALAAGQGFGVDATRVHEIAAEIGIEGLSFAMAILAARPGAFVPAVLVPAPCLRRARHTARKKRSEPW